MNWAQIIAACIIAFVTLLNLFFTLKGARENRKSDARQKYVDRQSDALENWWLLTIKSASFSKLDRADQDELIRHFIWLPYAVRVSAENIMKKDDMIARNQLRKSISFYITQRTDQGSEYDQ